MYNKIIFIAGESGSGKTTISKRLEEMFGLKAITSYTTRPKRYENEEGHIFLTDEEFFDVNIKDIAACTVFDGYKYWATIQQIEKGDIYVLDKDGIITFQKNYSGFKKPIIFYIKADEETRINRMMKRGDNIKNIIKRLKYDKEAFKDIEKYADYIIENNDNNNIDESVKFIWREFISC